MYWETCRVLHGIDFPHTCLFCHARGQSGYVHFISWCEGWQLDCSITDWMYSVSHMTSTMHHPIPGILHNTTDFGHFNYLVTSTRSLALRYSYQYICLMTNSRYSYQYFCLMTNYIHSFDIITHKGVKEKIRFQNNISSGRKVIIVHIFLV